MIVTDERKFNREAFFKMFDSFVDVEWTEVKHPHALDLLVSDSLKHYDVVIFYDMPEGLTLSKRQKSDLRRQFQDGVPAIFLHHSLLSYREWDEFPQIIGGRYYNKTPFITEAGDTIQSTYQHDEVYKIQAVDKNHPITAGITDFDVLDETYFNYFVKEDVKVLLTTEHPSSGRILGWINSYGKSEIVYLLNGHSETAYNNSYYRKILHNAIRWVALKNTNRR